MLFTTYHIDLIFVYSLTAAEIKVLAACMTDETATQSYERLFVPREGTVFHLP